VTAEKTGKNS